MCTNPNSTASPLTPQALRSVIRSSRMCWKLGRWAASGCQHASSSCARASGMSAGRAGLRPRCTTSSTSCGQQQAGRVSHGMGADAG
jgi:hypothetical protein